VDWTYASAIEFGAEIQVVQPTMPRSPILLQSWSLFAKVRLYTLWASFLSDPHFWSLCDKMDPFWGGWGWVSFWSRLEISRFMTEDAPSPGDREGWIFFVKWLQDQVKRSICEGQKIQQERMGRPKLYTRYVLKVVQQSCSWVEGGCKVFKTPQTASIGWA
jgi:hypothetical protein